MIMAAAGSWHWQLAGIGGDPKLRRPANKQQSRERAKCSLAACRARALPGLRLGFDAQLHVDVAAHDGIEQLVGQQPLSRYSPRTRRTRDAASARDPTPAGLYVPARGLTLASDAVAYVRRWVTRTYRHWPEAGAEGHR